MISGVLARFSLQWALTYTGVVLLVAMLLNLSTSFVQFGYSVTLPAIEETLHISHTRAGVLVTMVGAARMFSALLAGTLAPRYGHRIIIGLSALAMGGSMALLGFSGNYLLAVLAAGLMGFSNGGAITPMMGLLAAWFGVRDRGLAAGLAATGGSFGFILVGIAAPLFIAGSPDTGWRITWQLFGALTLVFGVAALIFVRERPATPPGAPPPPSPAITTPTAPSTPNPATITTPAASTPPNPSAASPYAANPTTPAAAYSTAANPQSLSAASHAAANPQSLSAASHAADTPPNPSAASPAATPPTPSAPPPTAATPPTPAASSPAAANPPTPAAPSHAAATPNPSASSPAAATPNPSASSPAAATPNPSASPAAANPPTPSAASSTAAANPPSPSASSPTAAVPPRAGAPLRSWPMEVYRNPAVWLVSFMAFCTGWGQGIFGAFFGLYLAQEQGISLGVVGQLVILIGILSVVSGIMWGRLSDRIGRGMAFVISFLMQGVAFVMFAFFPGLAMFVAASALVGVTQRAGYTICAASSGDYVPPQYAATAFGIIAVMASLGGSISPTLGGVVADYIDMQWSFVLGLAGLLAGAGGGAALHWWRPARAGAGF